MLGFFRKYLPASFALSFYSFHSVNSLTADLFLVYFASVIFRFLVCFFGKWKSSILLGKVDSHIFMIAADHFVKRYYRLQHIFIFLSAVLRCFVPEPKVRIADDLSPKNMHYLLLFRAYKRIISAYANFRRFPVLNCFVLLKWCNSNLIANIWAFVFLPSISFCRLPHAAMWYGKSIGVHYKFCLSSLQ